MMQSTSAPAIPAASRRAKRIIESTSPTPAERDESRGDFVDDEVEEEVEVDVEGEGYGTEEEPGVAYNRSGVSEDMELDDPQPEVDPEPEAEPTSALRIRLKVKADTSRPVRAAAKKSGKMTKRVALEAAMRSDDDEALYDELDDPVPDELEVMSYGGSSRRSASPSKMTARQRARGNKDLQDTLIALPNDAQGKKLILTEAERLQRREETARRRKRQSEQRLQDEQDQTINRLLRAQTGRSRAKLDGPSPLPCSAPVQTTAADTHFISSSRRPRLPPKDGMIRWVSSISGDDVIVRVGLPIGKEMFSAGRTANEKVDKRDMSGICGVEGCGEVRKYRSTRRFEVGGCCLPHLKTVEVGFDG